LIYPDYSF